MAKPKLNSDSKLNFAFNQELHILKDQIWKFSANVYSKCRHIITEFRTNKSTFLDSRATISCQYIDSSLPIYLTSVTKIHIYHPLFLSNSNLRREEGLIPSFSTPHQIRIDTGTVWISNDSPFVVGWRRKESGLQIVKERTKLTTNIELGQENKVK